MNLRQIAAAAALVVASGLVQAHGGIDGDAVIGGALGGAAGAAVGSAVGGRDGAIVGGALGAAAGVSLNTSSPRYGSYGGYGGYRGDDRYYYRERHDRGRHLGHYKHRHHHHYHD
jgi:hypothetical protein